MLPKWFGAGPTAHSRADAVGADYPARSDRSPGRSHTCRGNSRHWRFPEQGYAHFAGATNHAFMQSSAPDAHTLSGGKFSVDLPISIKKANAA
jgi:hypothetical protein